MVLMSLLTFVVTVIGMQIYHTVRQRRRARLEASAAHAVREAASPVQIAQDRDSIAFEQHRALNDLASQKMKGEIQLLAIQNRLAEKELQHREEDAEFRRLSMQKLKAELESLRLHIIEQRKRGESFLDPDED